MSNFNKQYGPWALVTGASSGIGKEFARSLAKQGLNVVVAARRKDRLDALVTELHQDYGVEARTITVDLTTPDFLEVIEAGTKDIEIGLLINNAGVGVPGSFIKRDVEEYTRVLQLNINAPMQLAHHYGRKLANRGRGGILFVSSIAGYTGSPFMANYAATKAYILNLGGAMNVELKPKGVDVLVVSPGPTRTEMVEMEGMDWDIPMPWMEASQVAEDGLKALGKHAEFIPGGLNRMMLFMATRVMPRKFSMKMFGDMMSKSIDSSIL